MQNSLNPLQITQDLPKIKEGECTCFKAHLNGRCQVCKEYYGDKQSELFKIAKTLVEKYPYIVNEMITWQEHQHQEIEMLEA